MFYLITMDNCPWCKMAIDYIENKLGKEVIVFHYKEHPIIAPIMAKAGLNTVPQVWFNKQYIGGYEALTEWTPPDETA